MASQKGLPGSPGPQPQPPHARTAAEHVTLAACCHNRIVEQGQRELAVMSGSSGGGQDQGVKTSFWWAKNSQQVPRAATAAAPHCCRRPAPSGWLLAASNGMWIWQQQVRFSLRRCKSCPGAPILKMLMGSGSQVSTGEPNQRRYSCRSQMQQPRRRVIPHRREPVFGHRALTFLYGWRRRERPTLIAIALAQPLIAPGELPG